MIKRTSRLKKSIYRLRKGSKMPQKRRRRKKGEIPRLKASLWLLCREITRKTFGNQCYTCPQKNLVAGNWQTGHYISSSTCSTELRFDTDNLRPQCYSCNIHKNGNTLQFRLNLIKEKGAEFVYELWNKNEATKGKVYPKEWFLEKIAEYEKILTP